MVSQSPASSLDVLFAALSDPTRRAILARLAEGEARVTELAEPFDMSLPAVSKHLKVLREAGLIEQQKRGRERFCSLKAESLKAGADWIGMYRSFWEERFDALAAYLERRQAEEPTS